MTVERVHLVFTYKFNPHINLGIGFGEILLVLMQKMV